MKLFSAFVGICLVSCAVMPVASWWSRRRRRRSCSARNCQVGSWSSWSSCTRTCGGGTQQRTRRKTVSESCGGSCPYSLVETNKCNTGCCPVDCHYTWTAWSNCTGCGTSNQTRSPVISTLNSCGGSACPSPQTRNCTASPCCPVNCVVGSWTSWGSCNAKCESAGTQVRTRQRTTSPSCGGSACPTLRETKACRGGCCRRDCLVSNWGSWGKCNASAGNCSANSGSRSRSRTITRPASCGGSSCPSKTESQRCTPVPITCQVSSWALWSTCSPTNGKCGKGSRSRTRNVTRQPYCSSVCPTLNETQACTHSCCPVNCVVSSWSAYSSCTATCGTGTKTRTRTVKTQPYCNGASCPALKNTTSCAQYLNQDCVMSSWSAYNPCSSRCGNGWTEKTRKIVKPAVCRGKACGPLVSKKQCTSYADNRDCVVSGWSAWGACSEKCAVGTRARTRTIRVSKRCRGKACPALKETSQCGTANNGCEHICANGVCSCRPGYNLAANKKNCVAKDCGKPTPRYCGPGTQLNSTCKHAIVTCPGGSNKYPVTCSLSCPQYYVINGASSITCQTSGQWTSYGNSFCRRINDPPTQIVLSGSGTVPENQPRGTKLGTFSSVDSNSKDKHTYTIRSGGNGKFEIRGAGLFTLAVFDFETSPNKYSVVVRSTDNGKPSLFLEKTFTISVTDVNEAPTAIQLSSLSVDENSDVDTTVGMLSTVDPDNGQTYLYTMLDSAGGRFKITGQQVKLAQSNKACLQTGGSNCKINFEQQKSHVIRIRSADSGSPSKSVITSITISVNNVNDQPRGLSLSNYTMKENAPLNYVIGTFSATDEDSGQTLSYSLDDDDSGRFVVNKNRQLLRAKHTDYESNKVHYITARVTDNGNPRLFMTKRFSIVVLNVNEAPVSITIDNSTVQENSKTGTVVGTVTATDVDAVQTLTFSLDDDGNGTFSLQGSPLCKTNSQNGTTCTEKLMVSGAINFEETSSIDVIARVTDDKGLFRAQKLSIAVIDVNDPPTNVTIDGSLTGFVQENSKNVQIDELLTEDEDVGQTFTYVLGDNGGGNFEIRGDKLFVSKKARLDYERVSSYNIRVKSTDSGAGPLSIEQTLTVIVQDVNESPTDIQLSKNTVLENTPTGGVIGDLNVTDPDNLGPLGVVQSHTCILTDSANGKIAVSKNQLTVGGAGVNFEENASVKVAVQCTDKGGLSLTKYFTINITDVNEVPTNVAISNTNVKENLQTGSIVGRLSVVDPDNKQSAVQTFSYSVVKSASSVPFRVQNGRLVTTRLLDYESNSQWTVRVKAVDSGSPPLSRTETFKVQVLDANDKPSGIVLSQNAVDENSAQDTSVGQLSSLDQDSTQAHSYLLLDSAGGRFKIDTNVVKVAASNVQCLKQGGSSCLLNYEAQKQHKIRLRTTDNGNPPMSYEKDFVISVRNVNDKPRELQLSSNRVKENATSGTVIGRFTSRDEDNGQVMTYSLSDDDSGRFRVDSKGTLYKAKDLNYETQTKHTVRAVVQDNGSPGLKMEKAFTIEVLDINEAPVNLNITSQGGQLTFPTGDPLINENSLSGTAVGTIEALDQDTVQKLTFKLDDDAGGKFALSSSPTCQRVSNIPGIKTKCTTVLQASGSLDYEEAAEHYIVARVTDEHGLFSTQQFRIRVADQNDRPTNVTIAGSYLATVTENSNGALVGELVTTDQDPAQTYVYKLLDDAAGRFVLSSGKLYVSSSANLDFESNRDYTVNVQSNDSGTPSLAITQNFQIQVTDVNESPTNFTLSNANVQENSPAGTVIGQFNVSDPDNLGPRGAWQTHVCDVTGQQVGAFVVNSNTLSVGSATLDFEMASSIDVQIKCTDSGSPSLYLEQVLKITVLDLNEAPTNLLLSSNKLAENLPSTLIGTFSTIDPDNNNQSPAKQTFKYTLQGDTAGIPFVISGDALKSTRSLDYETEASWNLTVHSRDSGNPPFSIVKTFQIVVTDVNEPPFNLSLSNYFVDENSAQGTLVGKLLSQEPDSSQTHSYTLVDGASGRFKLTGNTLQVALSNDKCLQYGGNFCKLNFEQQQQHVITVRVTDNGIPQQSLESNLTIYLNDVNDRPRDFKLSGYTVRENASIGALIGRFSASDEDASQVLSFSLVDDDKGRFAVNSSGDLYKAKDTDYETSTTHVITACVRDNGKVAMKVNQTFTIVVENINEAPVNITITSQDGQQSFPENSPQINENSAINTTIGTLISYDHDAVQALRFSLDDDAAGRFSVGSEVTCHNQTNIPGVKTTCSALLLVSGKLNYESRQSWDMIVRVTDNNGLFHTQQFSVSILNVNDRPRDVTLAGGTVGYVDENSRSALVGKLATVDEDAGQTHRYSLIDNGGWSFILRGNEIKTSWFKTLDYESQSVYSIKVRTFDSGQPALSLDQNFTIQIRDVNEQPTDIIFTSGGVPENSPLNTLVGNFSVVDPDNNGPRGPWQRHICLVLNTASIPFIVNVTASALYVAGNLNYEKFTFYDVTLRCHDDGSPPLFLDKVIRVNVLDVNEQPTRITLSNSVVEENAGIVTIGTFATEDPDNVRSIWQTFTYSVVSDGKVVPFVVDGDKLNTTRSLDYESTASWVVLIKSTDSKGLSVTRNFTITVTDKNDAPTAINASGVLMVTENNLAGDDVGTLVTADQDVQQTHQYQIINVLAEGHSKKKNGSDLLSLFSVESPSGRVTVQKSGLDYEQFARYTVTVNSTDSGFPPYSVVDSFVIAVMDVNEVPYNISISSNKVEENSLVGSFIGNLSVFDPDNLNIAHQKFVCFIVNSEQVPFKVTNDISLVVGSQVLDYETLDTYTVEVNCSEDISNPLSLTETFTITVTDVNEAPFNLTISGNTVKENGYSAEFVGDLSVQDPDTPGSSFANISFSIQTQTPSAMFKLVGSRLLTTASLNYEKQSWYNVTVVAQDSGNPPQSTSLLFTVEVIDVNDFPSAVILTSSGVYENSTIGTVVGSLRAEDEDNRQSHAFAIVGVQGTFEIRGSNLILASNDLNYETEPAVNVTVNATDNGKPPLSVESIITVAILDSNDPPSEIDVSSSLATEPQTNSFVMPENSVAGTLLANLTVKDDDAGQDHVCSLMEGGTYFIVRKVSEVSAEIVLKNVGLDYETMQDILIPVHIICTDNGSPQYSVQRQFNVSIGDVNEAPLNISFNGSAILQENAAPGYVIGGLTCEDPDIGQAHVFTVIGNYSSAFQVISSVLTVLDPSHLNYEHRNSLTLTIKATDSGSPPLDVTTDVTIKLMDVNEPPDGISLVPFNASVREDAAIGQCIAQITSKNPEPGQTVEFSLLNFQDTFKVAKQCGNASVKAANGLPYLQLESQLSFNEFPSYSLLINAMDNGIPPQSFNGSVIVRVGKVDPCHAGVHDCHANSTCSRVDRQNYTCPCIPGFTGKGERGSDCVEIDECLSNPCLHNGTCFDALNSYTCACPAGYDNQSDCNIIDTCQSSPCQNNGSCSVLPNNYTCFCAVGFEGNSCETNIDDCEKIKCVKGQCRDGIASFTCKCDEGYTGTLCQREIDACEPNPCDEDQICIQPDVSKEKREKRKKCFSKSDNVIALLFDRRKITVAEVADVHWQWRLEAVLKRDVKIRSGDLTDETDDEDRTVPIDDVVVTSHGLQSEKESEKEKEKEETRTKRSEEGGATLYTAIHFVVVASDDGIVYGVPEVSFFRALNKTCQSYICSDASNATFECKICRAGYDMIQRKGITARSTNGGRDAPLSDNRHGSLSKIYYVIAGLVGVMLLVIIVSVALCRRNTVNAKKRLAALHTPLQNQEEEFPTDAMMRHQLSNEQEGKMNPLYGADETELSMQENPVYEAPASATGRQVVVEAGIENPMYSSFKAKGALDPRISKEKPKETPVYQTPTSSKTPANKGFGNPLFSKQTEDDSNSSDEPETPESQINPLYAALNDPDGTTQTDDLFASSQAAGRVNPLFGADKNEKMHVYQTPRIAKKPGDKGFENQLFTAMQDGGDTSPAEDGAGSPEPRAKGSINPLYAAMNDPDGTSSAAEELAEAQTGAENTGFLNPMYQSRDEIEIEDVPDDILSAFDPSPLKRLDESGQSDC